MADAVDLVGFNYKPHDYQKKHEAYPNYILYGSETASTVSSRGEYKFPVAEKMKGHIMRTTVSSYDLEYPELGIYHLIQSSNNRMIVSLYSVSLFGRDSIIWENLLLIMRGTPGAEFLFRYCGFGRDKERPLLSLPKQME